MTVAAPIDFPRSPLHDLTYHKLINDYRLSPEEVKDLIVDMSLGDAAALQYDWRFWARPGQTPPQWDWRVWFLKGGRGSGKTWVGANQMNEWAKLHQRLALIGRTAADVRDTMIEGDSGIIPMSPPWFMPKYEPAKRRVIWPNGAFALCFTADEPNLLRGPQFEKAWCDELAAWRKLQEAWNNLMFGLRLGRNPQCIVTTTPRPLDTLKKILALKTTHTTTESTFANVDNLAEQWADEIISMYAGTRLGRQELSGEVLDDNPNALWSMAILDKYRVAEHPPLDIVVVAVDPSVSDQEEKDKDKHLALDKLAECGIVVGGRKGKKFDPRSHSYVLDDMTIQGKPEVWAAQVVHAYHEHKADKVVAEANNGGALVRAVIQAIDPDIPVELVHAARGKKTRAEPVSTLYEAGRVHHVGSFMELEQQQCEWEPGMKSPDRLDADVWLITDLMLGDDEPGRAFHSAAQ